MRLFKLQVKNFRSIEDASIDLGDITRVIGANGAGKSTILRAIELFYFSGTPNLSADDFFNRDQSLEIEITLHFHGLDDVEKRRFGGQVRADNTLTVSRVLTSNPRTSGKYYGRAFRCPDFAGVRAVETANDKKRQYHLLSANYPDLPDRVQRADEIEPILVAWEAANVEQCVETRDDGQFFGFQNVARGKLSDSTALVYVPAVRDASADAVDGRNTAIARLLELVVKAEIDARPDIKKFREETDKKFQELMNPENLTELGDLAGVLSATLATYYANAAVLLNWKESQPLSIQFPSAEVFLDDDGFVSTVDKTGHGLQRALIITLLQHLAIASRAGNAEVQQEEVVDEEGVQEEQQLQPSLLLAIEEPELYQHPTKQRHFSDVLERLASGQIPGVAKDTQVLFTTHSPTFVAMDRFEEVRLVRRHREEKGAPRYCRISKADLDGVAKKVARVWKHDEAAFTADSLRPRLHVFDGVVAEGFFAGTAVLVEGVSDRAALKAAALLKGVSLEAEEIAIIPAGGKTLLDKPFLVFRELGIPTFVMWDCDKNSADPQLNVNRALQRMVRIPEEGLEDTPTLLAEDYACFENTLETVLADEIGADWGKLLDKLKEKYGANNRQDAQKIPALMLELLREASHAGKTSSTLDKIVEAILALKAKANA